jgi:hypothetical protein
MPSSRKKEFNFLIGSCSARDIPEVLKERAKLPWDRFYCKYFDSWVAYPRMREFFLEHTEYTHLILAPDDLVVKIEHVKQIIEDVKQFNYPVISGMCNVDTTKLKDFVAIAKNLPDREYLNNPRFYDWYHINDIKKLKDPIIQVAFAGTPLMCISREILEEIEFRPDGDWNQNPGEGHSQDLCFCHALTERKIPIMVDTRVNMLHLRYGAPLMNGKLLPMLIYVTNKSKRF